jgi:pimeloyl-ACP methyl ester carboxylesterase
LKPEARFGALQRILHSATHWCSCLQKRWEAVSGAACRIFGCARYNRPGAKILEGIRESFWLQGIMTGFLIAYFCIKAFSETDFTDDLKKIDVPTLILHGDDDQIVPIANSTLLSSKIIKNAT